MLAHCIALLRATVQLCLLSNKDSDQMKPVDMISLVVLLTQMTCMETLAHPSEHSTVKLSGFNFPFRYDITGKLNCGLEILDILEFFPFCFL